MNTRRTFFLSIRISILLAFLSFILVAQPQPPRPAQKAKIFLEHGNQRADEYFWMNDPTNPAVIEHLKAENAYTEAMLKHTEPLQKKIYDELVARIEQTYQSLPHGENGFWYYSRFAAGNQYPFYCRRKGSLAENEEIFLDANALARGHQIYMIRGMAVSPNTQLLAYAVDTSGDRRSRLAIRNLANGSHLPDVIQNTSGSYVWAADNATLFYVLNDPTVRAYKVMRHAIGSDPAVDAKVFEESDSTYDVRISRTRDGRYVIITSWSTASSECRFIPADRPTEAPTIIIPRTPDLLYHVVEHEGGSFFIRTNSHALNFKLVATPAAHPEMSNWKDVLAHRSDALLEDVLVLRSHIVAQRKINGLPNVLVLDRRTNASHEIEFREEAFVANISLATDAMDADSIRFNYSSLTAPPSDYRYDLDTRMKTLLKQAHVGGGYDNAKYETKRIWATAADGKKVPISIVYKRSSFRRDGGNPMLLYAYGSYGASSDPDFDRSVISLLDRGFVYGIAHIRGGQELGRAWYEEGKILTKMNTFTDFIACADHLVRERYTAKDRLFANGVSAGGMLMGAVTNLRPDLFRGVLAEVPWTDVITDMFNTDLPLTTLEFDEWGNPAKKEHYDYMVRWSPYDNMHRVAYPAILATGGLNDTQVPFFSPAKWVARLRANNTGSNAILFRCNMGAGHSGESGRFERQKLMALKYAFMLDLLKISE